MSQRAPTVEVPITVEKGIPMPVGSGKGWHIYPILTMEIGDSFAVPQHLLDRVRGSVYKYGKYHGKKFIVRKYQGAHRCWRVE